MRRCAFLLAAALAAVSAGPVVAETKVVGFVPYYRPLPEPAVYERVTHLIYFAATPNPDGSLDTSMVRFGNLARLVREARAQDVQVMITVASFDDSGFPGAVATTTRRSRFVAAVVDLCTTYGLAGVDIDWEFPGEEDGAVVVSLMRDLRAALSAHALVLSADLPAHGYFGRWVPDAALEHLDWANIMSYEDIYPGDPDPNHASWAKSLFHLAYWRDRGLPDEKIILGIPFYGRTREGEYLTYAAIVSRFDPPASSNAAGGFYFNGPDLVAAKAGHVLDNDYGGVMIWELGQDLEVDDERSLLRAITDVIVVGERPARFRRGDSNDDGMIDISDPVRTLRWLFLAADAPSCAAAANVNGDARVDLADPLSLLSFIFLGGSPPVAPFPGCGEGELAADETLGCEGASDCP